MAGATQPRLNLPQGVVRVAEESTNLQDVIDAAVKERMDVNRRTKLTWDPQKLPIAGEPKMIGKELCLSLPWMLVDKKYYIQNMRIYMLNGEQTTLQDVQETENPLVFAHVKEAYDNMAEQALASDPNLCKYCWMVTTASPDAYMKHMIKAHPDVVMKIAQGEPEPKPVFTCETCSREFDTLQKVKVHGVTHRRGRPPKMQFAEPPSEPDDSGDEPEPEPEPEPKE